MLGIGLGLTKNLSSAGGGGAPPVNGAVDFSNGYLSRATAPVGIADGFTGTLVFFVNLVDPGAGSFGVWPIKVNADEWFVLRSYIYVDEGNLIITMQGNATSPPTERFSFGSINNPIPFDEYHCILLSWDGDNNVYHMYADDTDIKSSGQDLMASTPLAYTRDDWKIGFIDAGQFCMSRFYFTTEYIDFSVEANRRKFVDALGAPVDLGANGELPTGTPPSIYLPYSAAGAHQNAGSGGNFTRNGTLVDCATEP